MNHNHTRTFIASSELYSGFRVNIDIRYVNTLDDIVKIFLDEMKLVLKQNNFEVLLEKVVDKEFHIHSYTLEDILTSNPDNIFYVCNHCNIQQ
tara:strand:- start:2895 stop:3173 length:279 start_codon:yes stop_codon:yes gene_type:complete